MKNWNANQSKCGLPHLTSFGAGACKKSTYAFPEYQGDDFTEYQGDDSPEYQGDDSPEYQGDDRNDGCTRQLSDVLSEGK